MKLYTMVMTGLVLVGAASLASANPSMLPKHPGYPSGGQYANDTGQKNLTLEQSLRAAAASEDTHTGQKLVDPNDAHETLLPDSTPSPQPMADVWPSMALAPTPLYPIVQEPTFNANRGFTVEPSGRALAVPRDR